jgi:eukaryotic-like serine/threonine-protein kinase
VRVGNYTLGALLGRGGTSEVYAGEHRFLGDAVAVKLLRPALAGDERMRDAFLAEAARTREIAHGSVVRVIDFGHDEATGSLYLVMERIDGESLATRLRERHVAEPELRALGAAIADGMAAAHARGIVHRDLKPGNVMLRGDATPAIVDFGIAKSLGDTSAAVTERRIGTVAYMAPEQLTEGLITPAVDIWALGVILYEAATGQPPFVSFENGRLPQLFDTPPRPATLAPVSASLDALIMRCLDRDPARRPASMLEIARVLRGHGDERVTEDLGTIAPIATAAPATPVAAAAPAAPATPATPLAPADPAKPRRRWPIVIVAAAATAAIATVAVVSRSSGNASRAASAAADAATIGEPQTPAPMTTTAAPPPPATDNPATESPATESPATESPATENPATDNHTTPNPTTKRRPKSPSRAKAKTTRQGETLD